MSPVSILAIVVIYRREPSESESLCSLIQILNANPDLAQHFSIVVYDNSPQRQNFEVVAQFPVLYKHDPTNAGLATAYNFGLAHAGEEQYDWLLLLDQDTLLTYGFLAELIACAETLCVQPQVASIVPKLLVDGEISSPAAHFLYQLRHQYRRSNHAVSRQIGGIQEGRLIAFNSGAALRVPALRLIGGFPEEYRLDFLDHAVFHALSAQGYRMYVMHAEIKHDLSLARVSDVPVWRQRNFLLAQSRFVLQTGSIVDRLLYRIWLLRYSRILWIRHPDKRLWKEAALKALSVKSRTEQTSVHRGAS
jgi:GT2 family glycosyltransferase